MEWGGWDNHCYIKPCIKEEAQMKQHKWYKEIKAWADGAEIEYYSEIFGEKWRLCTKNEPSWLEATKYRIKPNKPRTHLIQVDCREFAKLIELTPEVIEALSAAGIEYD